MDPNKILDHYKQLRRSLYIDTTAFRVLFFHAYDKHGWPSEVHINSIPEQVASRKEELMKKHLRCPSCVAKLEELIKKDLGI